MLIIIKLGEIDILFDVRFNLIIKVNGAIFNFIQLVKSEYLDILVNINLYQSKEKILFKYKCFYFVKRIVIFVKRYRI